MNRKHIVITILVLIFVVLVMVYSYFRSRSFGGCSTSQSLVISHIVQQQQQQPGRILCSDPFVYQIQSLLTPEECRLLIQTAETKGFKRSTVVETSGEKINPNRTSSSVMFEKGEYPWLKRIEERISHITQTPYENQEGFQICRYKPGQEYKHHYDYFVTGDRSNQRWITIFVYLNTVQQGGHTHFPHLNLHVSPQEGTGVLWFNLKPDGTEDPRTLHAGTPPQQGVKYGLNIWIRQNKLT